MEQTCVQADVRLDSRHRTTYFKGKVAVSIIGKVKLSLCFNGAPSHEGLLGEWRYSSTHSLTSALGGGEWSASRPGRFTPRKTAPGTHWTGGWVGPRAVLDAVVKRKIPSPRRESNPRTPIIQPVAAFIICKYGCPKVTTPPRHVSRYQISNSLDTLYAGISKAVSILERHMSSLKYGLLMIHEPSVNKLL
jgi:hypothetical protein